jgi:antirestriction protein
MGVHGTLYLVCVDQVSGATQSDVIDGAVGVTQNMEGTQAAPIQVVTMGKTLKLVSLSEPLPENQVINQQELIKNTQPEILVKLINDVIERTQELANTTKVQQQTFAQTGDLEDIKTAIRTSFKVTDLTNFAKDFMDNLQKSEKIEEVKQALQQNQQTIEQLQARLDTVKTEVETIKSQVEGTAKQAGVSQEQIEGIGKVATGASVTPASEISPTTPTTPTTPTPTTSSTPTTPSTPDAPDSPPSGGTGGGGSSTIITSTDYTVTIGNISDVPPGTSKATFLTEREGSYPTRSYGSLSLTIPRRWSWNFRFLQRFDICVDRNRPLKFVF